MPITITRLPSDQFRARGYKTIPTPFFLLKIKNNQGDRVRIGIVAGRSVHKAAARRNFWKRQVRAGVVPRVAPGNDILIVLSPGVNRLTKKQFKEEMLKAFGRARAK